MIVSARQSGGFTGWTEDLGPVDTDGLDEADSETIKSTVKKIDFFSIPAHLPGKSHVELVAWSLDVEDGNHKHQVTWLDSSEDDRIKGLFAVIDAVVSSGAAWKRVQL